MQKAIRLRRRLRSKLRRRAARSAAQGAQRGRREAPRPMSLTFLRSLVCALLFTLLIFLKLLLPGNLAAFRGTLAQWLVRDADFAAAFSAVGQAVTQPSHLAEAFGEAYVAVFGESEAVEVSGAAEAATLPARELPDYVLAEAPELPFSYSAPLVGTLTSPFGWRDDPNDGGESFHTGLDLASEAGTPFASFADGTVSVVGESTVLGNYLTVLHDGGYETLYAHCAAITAVSGATVSRGETLGTVGATGNATGAHLHFELLSGGRYLDPLAYLDVGDEARDVDGA